MESTYTATAGTTPNFTYKPTSQGNLTTFDEQLASNTAYAPNATAYPPGSAVLFTSIGTIFSATPTSSSSFTVTLNGNSSAGGAMGPETASTPSFLTTNAFVRTGYTFAGWNTAALGTGTAYADGSTYTFTSSGSATLYAQWTPNPTYTVTFNQNGGTGTMLAQSGNYLQPLTANILTMTQARIAGFECCPQWHRYRVRRSGELHLHRLGDFVRAMERDRYLQRQHFHQWLDDPSGRTVKQRRSPRTPS